jgi:alpha-glucosidase
MPALPDWTRGIHHDGSAAHVSNPNPALGEAVTLRLRVPRSAPVRAAFVRTCPDGEHHHQAMHIAAQDELTTWWEAPLTASMPRNTYRFKLITETGSVYVTAGGVFVADVPDWFSFTLLAGYQAPAWVPDAVFYQIFPDRFHNGDPANDVADGEYEQFGYRSVRRDWDAAPSSFQKHGNLDFYGGDLQGITEKLDYLADLGVTALYLNPIFVSESNHKYDVRDFFRVDPHLGGDEALADLRAALDARGMRLMLDITPNHISYHHPWFTAARQDPDAPTAEYFAKNADGDFETWLGVPSLIKLNYASQKLRDVMYRAPDSALRHWMQAPWRIDGWRLDVANMTGNLLASQRDHEVWREMRAAVKADAPQAYLLGEYFQDGTPHLQGDELDASMNYMGFNVPVRRWIGGEDLGVAHGHPYGDPTPLPTEALAESMQLYLAAVPYTIALQQFNQISSHDITRILHVAGGDEALTRLAFTLLLTFVGTPCLYYGDEIGLGGGTDPDNRRPMDWHADRWNHAIHDHVRQLIALRHASVALRHGGFQLLHAAGDTISYTRQAPEQTLLVVCHRGPTLRTLALPVQHAGWADGTVMRDRLNGMRLVVADGAVTLADVPHGGSYVFEVERNT